MDGLPKVLARVDRLLSQAVQSATATAGGSSGPDPFRGLYVSDAEAARLVARGAAPCGEAPDLPLVDLEAAGPRWVRVALAFGLAPIEMDVLALALASELDLKYERVFGYLHDDLTRRRLTPDLVFRLVCGSWDERLAARRLFAPEATLVRCGLVHLSTDASQPPAPVVSQAITLDEGLVAFLLGEDRMDRRLAEAARWDAAAVPDLPADAVGLAQRLRQALEAPLPSAPHFLLQGPNDGRKRDVARRVAGALHRPLLIIDLTRLAQLELPMFQAVSLAARTAHLYGGLTLWTGGEALSGGEGVKPLEGWLAGLEALGVQGALLAAAQRDSRWPAHLAGRFVSLDFPVPDAAERAAIWSCRLEEQGIGLAREDAALLGEVFRLDPEAIERAVAQAVTRARWQDRERPAVAAADLLAAGRAQFARALPRYATRIEPVHGWEDIILPDDQLAQLRELCNSVRHRHTVLDRWGFSGRLPLGRGVAALFAGPSGTGKTMAAQIIAATLGLDLYRVEIPAVVSKYIGETEKALDQLFREAQGTSVILFFDEADALFGKRSEVRDAHDRYANIETSYLLQALEQYEGLVILATNFRHNLDEAFVRRLAFSVTFPFPEEAERARIWQRCWPERLPLADDVDAEFLARRFKLTGGNIRNVALAAAFSAAANGGRVTMAHVIRAVRREYQKMGKVCVESEFAPYFELLTQEGSR